MMSNKTESMDAKMFYVGIALALVGSLLFGGLQAVGGLIAVLGLFLFVMSLVPTKKGSAGQ